MKHFYRGRVILFVTMLLVLWASWGIAEEKTTGIRISPTMISETQAGRTVTYYQDQTLTVPAKIERIACGWPAQNSVIAMLGYGDKIVATVDMIKSSPIFGKFVPSIKDAVACFQPGAGANMEELLKAKPDVAFMPGSPEREKVMAMGIPVACLKDNSMENLVDRTVITGRILGEDAYRSALAYAAYHTGNVKKVSERISAIPESKRVKIYHSMGTPLTTMGAPSLNQDWMDLAGVINVARDWKLGVGPRTASNVNLEQVVAADPDVIICMRPEDVTTIKTDPGWSGITAVKTGKVYANPKGMFLWCRETTEEALQFLWIAKTVYPARFEDVDMEQETRHFYKIFYGYDLSDEDVRMFLDPR